MDLAPLNTRTSLASETILPNTNGLELCLHRSGAFLCFLDVIVLHPQPERPGEIFWNILVCGLHKNLHTYGRELVVAQVDLLDAFAMLEEVRQLPSSIIINPITEELEDFQVWALLANANDGHHTC